MTDVEIYQQISAFHEYISIFKNILCKNERESNKEKIIFLDNAQKHLRETLHSFWDKDLSNQQKREIIDDIA